jgi:uncharacterized membrane protein
MSYATGLYNWLLLLHILAAMVWVGGGVLLAVLATRVLREREPGAVARFVGGMRVIAPVVLAPATVAVVAIGVWMVLDSSAWGFDQLWVQLALGLFAGAFVVGAAYQSRAAIKADRAAAAGDRDEALRQLSRWSWGYRVILLLLIVATWDMVMKPGL